jgi:hypothetical protein
MGPTTCGPSELLLQATMTDPAISVTIIQDLLQRLFIKSSNSSTADISRPVPAEAVSAPRVFDLGTEIVSF